MAALMAPSQRRAFASISWRSALALVLFKAGGDAAGLLLGGDRAYAARSYDLLRLVPGGMRTYGFALAVLFVVTVIALSDARTQRHLQVCMALLAGWYVGWLLAIVSAWWARNAPMAWGAVPSLIVIAALAFLVARATPGHGSR